MLCVKFMTYRQQISVYIVTWLLSIVTNKIPHHNGKKATVVLTVMSELQINHTAKWDLNLSYIQLVTSIQHRSGVIYMFSFITVMHNELFVVCVQV